MPNPFNTKSTPQPQPGAVEIKNSTLVCDQCFDVASEGTYYESKSLLVFTCPNGHHNEVNTEL